MNTKLHRFVKTVLFASQLHEMVTHVLTTACPPIIVQCESRSTATLERAICVGAVLLTATIVVIAFIDIY